VKQLENNLVEKKDETAAAMKNASAGGSIRRLGSNVNATSRVVIVTTASPHKLNPGTKCIEITGFSNEDSRAYHYNDGLKYNIEILSKTTFSFPAKNHERTVTAVESRYPNAEVIFRFTSKQNQSNPDNEDNIGEINFESQGLCCERKGFAHDDEALHHAFVIKRIDEKPIESTKVNAFKQRVKGNHKKLIIHGPSEISSDFWMSRFAINFERTRGSSNYSTPNFAHIPVPPLTEIQAEKFKKQFVIEKKKL
jgi:hypothetical protein